MIFFPYIDMEPGLPGDETAQKHLAYERTNKISYDMLEQGADVHATETRAFDNHPDVYINGDDVSAVTVTIDPLRHTQAFEVQYSFLIAL